MQKSIEDSQAEAKDLDSKLAATTSKLAEVTVNKKRHTVPFSGLNRALQNCNCATSGWGATVGVAI